MPYVPSAILFDGTTDFLLRGADLTGIVDSKTGIFSTWIRLDGGDGSSTTIFANATARLRFRKLAVDRFEFRMQNVAAGTNIALFRSVLSYVADPAWLHLLTSWDLIGGITHLYVDDVSDNIQTTAIDDFIDYTAADWSISATVSGAEKLTAALSDLYFAPGQFLDFSIEANRRKFIDAAGNPVFLGVSGEEPTGSPASVYLRGNQTDQGINSGTGGDFVSQATQVPGETTGPVTSATSSASGLVDGPMFHELESAAGYITGPAFRLGSNKWTNQFVAPDTLCSLEGSNDKLNWRIVTDTFNSPISALADVMRVGGDRTAWLRFVVAADAMEPRLFTAIIQNQKLLEEGR